MAVLHNSIVLARRVGSDRQHRDLTHCPGSPEVYGLFDPVAGEWLAVFDQVEAREQLQRWPVITPRPGAPSLPRSEITVAGERWLTSAD